MALLGVGVDIIYLQRIQRETESGEMRFFEKIFTDKELAEAKKRPDAVAYFASRFAAKEAVFKSFSTTWDTGIQMNEIEIIDGKFGEPLVNLKGEFAKLAAARKVKEVMVSISYDTDYAIAFAVLSGY